MKLGLAIFAGLIIGFFAWSAVKSFTNKRSAQVHYYPRANVYHDVNAEEYFFYNTDQKTWYGTRTLRPEQKASLGDKIVVPSTQPVWKNYQQVRMVHSIALFSRPEQMRAKFIEDSLMALPKKPVSVPTPRNEPVPEEKEKKGLRKFLDNIFKGKKDKTPLKSD